MFRRILIPLDGEEAQHYLESIRENHRSGSLTPSITNINLEITCSVVSDKDIAHAIIKYLHRYC